LASRTEMAINAKECGASAEYPSNTIVPFILERSYHIPGTRRSS
jgi:hypothetical protein